MRLMMRKYFSIIVIVALVFSMPVPVAVAADSIFGAGTGDWATAGNWSAGIPGVADTATINANVSSISSGVASVNLANFSTGTQWGSGLTLTVATMATFNGTSNNFAGTIIGNATFNNSSYTLGGSITGDVIFNGTSYNRSTINGDATFNTTYYGVAPSGGVFTVATGNFLRCTMNGTVYGSDAQAITNYVFNGTAYYRAAVTGDATFNDTSYLWLGTLTGNATFNDTSYLGSSGIVSGDATFNTTYYGVAPSGGVFTIATGIDWSGTVNGTVYGTDAQAITDYIFNGTARNLATITGDVTFNDTSSNNNGTITGNVTFNDTSYSNNGTINGSVVFNSSAAQSGTINAGVGGTVTGNFSTTGGITFQSGTVSSIISGTGGVSKTGAGTVTLSGAGANTYSGVTTVTAGELDLNKTATVDAIAGDITINGGTLKWLADNQIADTSAITMTTGALSLNGMDETVTSFSNSGGIFTTGAGTLIGTGATVTWAGGTNTINDGGAVQDGHIIITGGTNTVEGGATGGVLQLNSDGGAGLEMTGATLTLNSDTVVAGKLTLKDNVETFASATTSNISNGLALANSGTVDLDSGTRTFTVADGAAAADLSISANIINGGLTKAGAGLMSLSGTNTYSGTTTVSAGTLQIGDGGTTGTLGTGAVTNNATIIFNRSDDLTVSNAISGSGALTKNGAGTLTLSGTNTYSGTTTISAGTLKIGSGSDLGGGDVVHNAIFDIGLNTVNVGAYTQGGASTLNVSIDGTTNGSIVATGLATVNAGDSLVLSVSNYVPNNSTFTIIDGTGGAGVVAPSITDNSSVLTFSATTVGADLMLTASRSNPYSSVSNDPNIQAAAEALEKDGENGVVGDMLTILNTLDGMNSNPERKDAIETMIPDLSSGALQGARETMGQFMGSVRNRLGYARNGVTGIATGDMFQGVGFWMQGLGSHLKQDTRKGIEGFSGNVFGSSIGADTLLNDHLRVGIAGGYGRAKIRSKTPGSPGDDINSWMGTIYGSYDSANLSEARHTNKNSKEAVRNQAENSWYVDGTLGFTQNNYDSQREIWLTPATKRVAKADHHSQQYSTRLESGYTFVISPPGTFGNLEVTPFAALEYNYLYMNKYKETGANALNLSVDGEGYHELLQSLGTKFAYPIVSEKMGTFIPAVKAAWLYDYIGDKFESTASFAGGGTSFTTNGAKPAQNSLLIGGELAYLNKDNMTLTANYDLELKDQFASHTYYATARFDF